jgi:multidrug efflux pump subunit AcrB
LPAATSKGDRAFNNATAEPDTRKISSDRLARRRVADDEPARSHSLTDQTIVKALENVPGVARIDVNGRMTRQIPQSRSSPIAVTALGIGVDQVIQRVRAANQDVPAGRITRGHATRSSASKARSRTRRNSRGSSSRSRAARGLPVAGRRRDRRREGADSISRINGRPSITLDIQKAQDANIVETGRGINEAIAALKEAAAGRRRAARRQLDRRQVERASTASSRRSSRAGC